MRVHLKFIFCILAILFVFACAQKSFAFVIKIVPRTNSIEASIDSRVELDVSVTDEAGRGAPGLKPLVAVSRGEVTGVTDSGDGRYVVSLIAPPLKPPRMPEFLVAMVSVSDAGGRPDAAAVAIPVISTLELKGRTAPGATIFARAKGRGILTEKAAVARDGSYALSIPVPPGIAAIEVVVAKDGAERVNRIDLKMKKRQWLLAQPVPDVVESGGAEVFVNVASFDFEGNASKDAAFKLFCSPGVCGAPGDVSPGVFQSKYISSSDASNERAVVKAVSGGSETLSEIKIVEPSPSRIELTSITSEVAAGDSIVFDAAVFSQSGKQIEARDAGLRIDGVSAVAAVSGSGGKYSFNYAVPSGATPGEIKVVAICSEGSVVSNELSIRVVEPRVILSLEDVPKSIGAGARAPVVVRARTASEPGVDNLILKISPDGGSAGEATPLGGGRYRFEFIAPEQWEAESLRLEVSAPDANGSPSVEHVFAWDASKVSPSKNPARLALSAASDKVMPGDKILLTAVVYSETGAGVAGQAVNISSTLGTASEVRDSGGGVFTAEIAVPEAAEPGKIKVEAVCECGGANLTGEAAVEILLLPPSSIAVAAQPDTIYVSGKTEAEIVVTIKNKTGRGVPGEKAQIKVTQGQETENISAETGADGVASARAEMKRPDGLVTVMAAVESNTSLSAKANIRKMIYDVSRIELTTAADELPADGASSVEVEAYAIDEMANDASYERVDFVLLSGSGRINKAYCITEEDARCSILYTAGLACGTVEIEAFSYRQNYVRKKITFTETPKVPKEMTTSVQIKGGPLSTTALIADASSEAEITAVVRDAGNCLIPGERIYFSVSSGEGDVDASAVTGFDGSASATYTTGFAMGQETVLARTETSPLVMRTEELDVLRWTAMSFDAAASPQSLLAGESVSVQLAALDAIGRTVTNYDPSTRTFSFSGPGVSPGGNQPDYPSSSVVRAAFSSGRATVENIRLYDDETSRISVSDGRIQGRTGNITVSHNVVERIEKSSSDGGYYATDTNVWLRAVVKDAYGNAVDGIDVAFAITGGNGVLTGPSATTDSNGYASPGSYAVNSDVRDDHQVTASIATGTVRDAVFNFHSATPPTAAFTYLPASICPGTAITFNPSSSAAAPPLAPGGIAAYSWDFDGDGISNSTQTNPTHTFANTGAFPVALTVWDSHWISDTHTETINVGNSAGVLSLVANPNVIKADGASLATISSSGNIEQCSGQSLHDGTLFTVSTTLGEIATHDEAPHMPGIQVASHDGRLEFIVRSVTSTGDAVVSASAVHYSVSYSDTVQLRIGDNIRPVVVSASPSGRLSPQIVNQIQVVFSESVQSALITNPANFTVENLITHANIPGAISYNPSKFTATFVPAGGIDISTAMRIGVTISSNVKDIEGNSLSRTPGGDPESYYFMFGLDAPGGVVCTEPVAESCSAVPATFSPNGDSTADTTAITFRMTDNHGIQFYTLNVIDDSGDIIRTLTEVIDAVDDGANTTDITLTRTWDGRNYNAEIVENGDYRIEVAPYDFSFCYDATPCAQDTHVNNPIDFGDHGP